LTETATLLKQAISIVNQVFIIKKCLNIRKLETRKKKELSLGNMPQHNDHFKTEKKGNSKNGTKKFVDQ